MPKRGKTSYSPSLRLQMKLSAEKPKAKGNVQTMVGSVKELVRDTH